ncbi:MAG: shikimate kinase AroK [Gammaproteobacteria bacterium]
MNISPKKIRKRIFLIGPMGAGKSTLGRRLAKSLHLDYCDTDEELVERTGASISLIFDVEGEEGFRDREANLLLELTERDNLVLATGGGIVLREQNRRILRERGFVVYLHAPLERLYERTSKDTSRPLLQTGNAREKLREIVEQRGPLYEQTADISVDTDIYSIAQLVNYIKGRLPWSP